MYSEPDWSQATSKPGYFEVLKNGKIFETVPIPLGTRFMSFGRLPENDVTLEHESISRKHAVLQFGPRNSAFIFDLGSTHGTFLNKKQIPSSQYIKITSENDIVQFGASSRLFLLNLTEDDSVEEKSSAPSSNDKKKEYRSLVLKFFESHGIPSKSISFFQKENVSSCHFNYSDYISIDSPEQSSITSSGGTKREAFENFYEDSFNFLYRLGLIENEHYSYSDDDSESDNEFHNNTDGTRFESEKSTEALSEQQIVHSRDQFNAEIEAFEKEILELKGKLKNLEGEIVDDFDVYIQDLKKAELKKDIVKRLEALDSAKREFLKYEKILNLIGFQENLPTIEQSKSISVSKEGIIPQKTFEETEDREYKKSKHLESKSISSKFEIVTEAADIEGKEFENIIEFEDSTLHEDKVDLTKLKRKYGY